MHEDRAVAPQPGRRDRDLGYHALAQAVVELRQRRVQRRLVADRMAGEEAGQLQIVIAQQEQPAALIDQPEHDAQRLGVVRPVVGEVAELNDEAVGCGGVGECDGVAMHVAHHADGGVLGDGSTPFRRQPAARSADRNVAERETEQSFLAQQEDAAATGEQPGDRGIAHVEPAGVGAERRHHQAPGIGDEARAATLPPRAGPWPSGGGGRRSRPRAGRRLVAEHQAAVVNARTHSPPTPRGGEGSWLPCTQMKRCASVMARSRESSPGGRRAAPSSSWKLLPRATTRRGGSGGAAR